MATRAELEAALEHYQQTVRRAAATGDWTLFAGLFTRGRRLQRACVRAVLRAGSHCRLGGSDDDQLPRQRMVDFPVGWAVFDTSAAWIVCEIRNVMRDPGDGSCARGAEPDDPALRG